jgi:Xaa-Pro dipeptidase
LFAGTEIKDISAHVKHQRMIKSEWELAAMRRAALMNEALYQAVPDMLEEGLTEVEFAGRLEALYRAKGHQGYVRVRGFNQEVFYGHVMSGGNLAVASCSVGPTGGPGVNPSMPQGPGMKRIGRHEPVQIDYVGVVDGYMVDQARTYYLGEPPEEFRRVHATALAIQERLVQEGRSGVRAEELYLTAMSMAEEAGYADGFLGYPQPVPFVGHGVGLELDELPLVGRKSPTVLEEGMVIALEPKFILPGKGLAGIENSFLVTPTGLEKITLVEDEICVVDR